MELDRLEEMMIEAGRSGSLQIVLLAPPSQCDQDRPFSIWQSPQALCSLDAVHPWHSEIEEDDVRAKRCCCRKAFLPIGRGRDLMPQLLQQHRERSRGVLVVIDDENSTSNGRANLRRNSRPFGRRGRFCQWQSHGKGAATAFSRARYLHRTAMHGDELPHQRQADPKAAVRVPSMRAYL